MALRRLFYTDHHEIPLPPGHRFPMRKYRLLRERLQQELQIDFLPAPPADPETIELAHEPEFVRQFLTGQLSAAAMRRIGFPWSESLVKRTLSSVGGTIAAATDALEHGCGGTLAGGTHHAFRAAGSGFCVFNDIAVAIQHLRHEGHIVTAAILDLDVHQGDGTAEIFQDDDNVLTVSLHGKNNFPFRKQQSRIDIALPDGTTDGDYIAALVPVLARIAAFQPDILLYQSGVDGLASDVLGRLSLTHDGLQRRDRLAMEFCRARDIPLVITLGGGYAQPIEDTAEAHANTFRIAVEVFGTIQV